VKRQDKDDYHAGYRDGRDAGTLSEPSASCSATFGLMHSFGLRTCIGKHPTGPPLPPKSPRLSKFPRVLPAGIR
jgi:hypothetical protein